MFCQGCTGGSLFGRAPARRAHLRIFALKRVSLSALPFASVRFGPVFQRVSQVEFSSHFSSNSKSSQNLPGRPWNSRVCADFAFESRSSSEAQMQPPAKAPAMSLRRHCKPGHEHLHLQRRPCPSVRTRPGAWPPSPPAPAPGPCRRPSSPPPPRPRQSGAERGVRGRILQGGGSPLRPPHVA